MSYPVYSERFIALSGYSGGPTIEYTVPSGFVAVIKCIAVSVGANTAPVGWRISLASAPQLARWDLDTLVTAGGTQLLEGHWVLAADEEVQVETVDGLAADFFVSGFLLTLP